MARKTKNTATTKPTRAKTVIEDNFVAPKRRRKAEEPKPITLQEALAESGQTIEELTAPQPKAEEATARPVGTSNLATTIRNHRSRYAVALHPNGKKTQNNGDSIATLLLPIPLDVLKAFSAARFGESYDHLNPGHARMCIGNRIRGAMRRGDEEVHRWLIDQQPKQEGEEAEEAKQEAKEAKRGTKKAGKAKKAATEEGQAEEA